MKDQSLNFYNTNNWLDMTNPSRTQSGLEKSSIIINRESTKSFLLSDAAMYSTVFGLVILYVCPYNMHVYCDKTKEPTAKYQYFCTV